jgi:hypothetical protein
MNITEMFAKQIAEGANEKNLFFYGIEAVRDEEEVIEMRVHKGSLDTFPNLTYVNHLHEMFPLFRS